MIATQMGIRYALRSIRRTPLVSAAVVTILSLSIALVTMLFGIINGVFFHPLPYPDATSLVALNTIQSLREAVDGLGSTSTQLQAVATFDERPFSVQIDGDPFELFGSRIDTMFFPVFHVAPVAGSVPQREELRNDGPVALIGERLWVSSFARRPDIVGQTLRVDGTIRRIVGVMPKWFTFPTRSQIWVPFPRDERGSLDYVTGVGRMKKGGSLEGVQREAQLVTARLIAVDPAKYRKALSMGWLYPSETIVRRGERFGGTSVMWVVLTGAICVLIAATSNLAALMLARGMRRRGEMLIRASLGATRLQLFSQQVLEGAVLGIASGGLGLLLSVWGSSLLLGVFPKLATAIPGWLYLGIDWRVGLFASAMSLAAITVFSVWPAMEAVRVETVGALRSGSDHAISQRDSTRQLHLPIVLQVSVSVILIVASAILAGSAYEYTRGRTLFFENLYTARLVSQRPGDTTRSSYSRFRVALGREIALQQRSTRVARIDRYAGLTDTPASSDFDLRVPETNRSLPDPFAYPGMPVVSDNYFAVLGVRLLRGRSFDDSDPGGIPTAAVVSERFAREVWGGVGVIGKELVLAKHRIRIIGVSENVKRLAVVNGRLTFDEGRDIFLSERQVMTCCNRGFFVARSDGGPKEIARAISAASSSLGLSTAVSMRAMAQELEGLQTSIVMATILGIFAVIAAVFAGVGIYGLVAFTVVHRLREAGIRRALGAQERDIVRLMMGGAMRLVAIGAVVGLVASLVVGKMLSEIIITTTEIRTITAIVASFLFVCLGTLASYLPVQRSVGTDAPILLRD